MLVVIAQVIPCQGCYFQRFEILIAHGVKGRRPLENQGFLSISSAKMHKKYEWPPAGAAFSPVDSCFSQPTTTHHNPPQLATIVVGELWVSCGEPQLATIVVGELWVSCGELWWACHNSPENEH